MSGQWREHIATGERKGKAIFRRLATYGAISLVAVATIAAALSQAGPVEATGLAAVVQQLNTSGRVGFTNHGHL